MTHKTYNMIKISSQIGNLLFEQDVLDPRILFFCTDGLVAQEVAYIDHSRIGCSQLKVPEGRELCPGKGRVNAQCNTIQYW